MDTSSGGRGTCKTMSRKKYSSDPMSDDSGVGGFNGSSASSKVRGPGSGSTLVATPDRENVNNLSMSGAKRNKRKSAEPKRRGEVLQMKRFRWESDDNSCSDQDDSRLKEVSVSDQTPADCLILDAERPASSDSGCHSISDNTQTEQGGEGPRGPEGPERQSVDKGWGGSKVIGEGIACPVERFRKTVIQTLAQSSSTNVERSKSKVTQVGRAQSSCNNITTTRNGPHLQQTIIASKDVTASSNDLETRFERENDEEDERQRSSRPRNYYKSMSRQRRIEANARERTRVHTISAAFENLRRAVPAYADSQKLSKLAILKIASAYILALACLNNQDYSEEQNQPSLSECVEMCTGTIQAEGRARRRNKD